MLLRTAAAIALAALTIPSALFAQERQYPQYPQNQYPQYRTNNVPAGRPAPPAPPAPVRPLPPRPIRPLPRPSGFNPQHLGNRNDRPLIYVDGNSYLQTPVPQEPRMKPQHTATPRPADAPEVFDSYSTK